MSQRSQIPRGAQSNIDIKMQASKYGNNKDTVSSNAHALPKTEGILKHHKENVQRKNPAKVYKGYGQAELRDQNQLLIASNEELHKNLIENQQRIAELELQLNDLEKENADVHNSLKDCHVLLVAGKIDPVLGETIGEAAQQSENDRKEVRNISSDLLKELQDFSDVAAKQLEQLEAIQTTMRDLTVEGERVVQEREHFSLDVLEMEKALEEAERLLME